MTDNIHVIASQLYILYFLHSYPIMSARPVVKTSTMTSAQMQEFAIVAAQVCIFGYFFVVNIVQLFYAFFTLIAGCHRQFHDGAGNCCIYQGKV